MVVNRALTKFLLVALLVLQTREVRADSRLESFVHDELQFGQGLGFPSTTSFHGDFAHGMLNGVEDVVQAWYMDETTEEDQRLPHHRQPDDPVPLAKLLDLGIIAMRLDADNHENDENLTMIRGQRGYMHMDIVTLTPEKMSKYEAMIKRFFEEHLHADEEVRYCLEGSGYFDVRDEEDRWVRVSVRKGGLIVVPAGIYHRFTLDTNNYIKEKLSGSFAKKVEHEIRKLKSDCQDLYLVNQIDLEGSLLQLALLHRLDDPAHLMHADNDPEAAVLRLGYVKPEVISWTPRIIVFHNFLSSEECDYLMAIARPRLQISTVVDVATGKGVKSDVRTSSGMFVNSEDRKSPVIQAIEKRISVFSQIPKENGELIQVLRYERSPYYRPHHDYFSDTFNLKTWGAACCYNVDVFD